VIDPHSLSSDLQKILDFIELPVSESQRLGLTGPVIIDIIDAWLVACEIEAHKEA